MNQHSCLILPTFLVAAVVHACHPIFVNASPLAQPHSAFEDAGGTVLIAERQQGTDADLHWPSRGGAVVFGRGS